MCFGSSSEKPQYASLQQNKTNSRIKLILLGDMHVGKTSICKNYQTQMAVKKNPNTLGVTYFEFNFKTQSGQNIHLDIWDTAGQEQYQSLLKMYYYDANIVFLVFNVGEKQSFDRLQYWLGQLKEQRDLNSLKIVLIGNRCDTDTDKRQVSYAMGEQFSKEHKISYYETNALTGSGVVEVFQETVEDYALNYLHQEEEQAQTKK